MIEWWYKVVKPTFERPGRSQLRCILTDTDSFIFAVDYYDADVNVFADIADIAETLDMSVYQECQGTIPWFMEIRLCKGEYQPSYGHFFTIHFIVCEL